MLHPQTTSDAIGNIVNEVSPNKILKQFAINKNFHCSMQHTHLLLLLYLNPPLFLMSTCPLSFVFLQSSIKILTTARRINVLSPHVYPLINDTITRKRKEREKKGRNRRERDGKGTKLVTEKTNRTCFVTSTPTARFPMLKILPVLP